MEKWTPYITIGIVTFLGLIAWAFKKLFYEPLQKALTDLDEAQEDIVVLETSFKFYLNAQAKGAAMVLDSPNPTPPQIRLLLQKQQAGQPLTNNEREELVNYLRDLKNDVTAPKSERNAAIQLLATIETLRLVAGRGN